MSSSNTSTANVDAIKNTSIMFAHIWSYLLIGLGTIGHSLNIYVFTRPTRRLNPCVLYFLAATISGLLVTFINTPLRLIQQVYNFDAFGYSSISCKILTYIVLWTRAQTSWFIALACMDRFLCSSRSVAIRAWSNPRIASLAILFTIPAVGLSYIYVPIQYQIRQTNRRCPASQGNNLLFNGIWNLIVFSLGPSIVMLIFGSLTIRHVHSSVRRVAPQTITIQNQSGRPPQQEQLQRQKTTDRQLTQMMVVQIVYFSLLSSPVSVNWLYTSLRSNLVIDALQSAKDDLFANISGYLALTCGCTSFYLFTLSSQLFRRELIHLFKGQRRANQENTVNTLDVTQKY